jgi:glycosyltransferase involved in cell wall biosynthesis
MIASGDLWAGAEVMLYHLCCGLNLNKDMELAVLLLNDGALAQQLSEVGCKVLVVDESEISFFHLVLRVRKFVAQFRPDIIHSHRYKENILAFLAKRMRGKIQLVATQHGLPECRDHDWNPVRKLRSICFFRLLSHFFDFTVFVSNEMYDYFVGKYNFNTLNTKVIYNGIRLPLQTKAIKNVGVRLVIGSAGRLFPIKNYTLMIDVARLLVAKYGNIDFVLVGDGPEKAVLEQRVKECGLNGRFCFLGHKKDMEVFYKRIDVYINTSFHEGLPLSVLEAMSYGLPVIAPKVGGLPEIISDGEQGYLIQDLTPESFVQKIELLLSEKNRIRLGSAARRRVETKFTSEIMVDQYYRVYKKLYS